MGGRRGGMNFYTKFWNFDKLAHRPKIYDEDEIIVKSQVKAGGNSL
jgi:hypothetical protein